MKKLLLSAAALIMIAALAVTFAFAANNAANKIKVDGNFDNGVWYQISSCKDLITAGNAGDSELNWAGMYHFIENKTNTVYYAFLGSIDKPTGENTPGIIITFDNAGTVALGGEEALRASFGDGINTSGEAVMTFDDNNITCEAYVNYKNGIPATVGGSVKFIGTDGKATNQQDFSFANPGYYTTAVTETEKPQKTTKSGGNRNDDTTRDSINVYDFITSARTTTKKQTTKKATTAGETSAVKTTAEKKSTTKKAGRSTAKRTATQKAETSIVYVIPDTVTATAAQDTAPASTAESSSAEDSAFQLERPSSGNLMKIITAVSAAVLFGVIGVVAVRSRSDDDKDDKANENADKED